METKKFIDVLEIYNGKNQKSVENPDGKYPIYGSGGVMGRADEYICPAETVVIGRKGSINNPIFVTEPFWNVDTAFGLVAKKEVILPKYLFYFCRYFDFDKLNTTVTIPSLTKANLLKIEMPVPSIIEQKNIVTKLNLLADMIQQRQEQLTKLDEFIKARFVEMFGDPKLNPYRFLCNSLSTYITFLTSGSRGWSQYFTDSGEYFITIKNVKNCKITLQDVQYVAPPDNAEAKRTKVQKNDLLISITADLGRTGVVTEEIANHGAYINQHLTCIRLKNELVNPLYVAYYMESDAGKEQFTAKNQSAVKAGLNFNAINSLKLMVPPLPLQNQFADFVAEVDKSKLLAELFAQNACILAENRSK